MLDIKITKAATLKAKPADESKLGFGKISTDHMFLMDYNIDKGWYDPRIVPYAPFELDPAWASSWTAVGAPLLTASAAFLICIYLPP